MIQLSLFDEEKIFNLKDLINSDFNFFKSQKNLSLDNKNKVEKFLYDYNYENPIYYHCSMEFNKITKNSKYKYIIFDVPNDDKIFIMYKVIQIMNVKKIKIIDKPFSIKKNVENEKKIINILLKKDFINLIFKEKYLDFYKDYIFEESIQDFDYYIDFEEEYKKSLTPNYKKRKKINRYENNNDFKIEIVTKITDALELENLRSTWKNTKTNVKQDNEFNLFVKNNDVEKLFLNIYYNNHLIFNSIFIVKKDYLINVFESSLAKYYQKNDDNIYLKTSTAHIDDVANYFISKYFLNTNIKRSYMAGANPKHISLVNFKEAHSNGKIKYYKIIPEKVIKNGENVKIDFTL